MNQNQPLKQRSELGVDFDSFDAWQCAVQEQALTDDWQEFTLVTGPRPSGGLQSYASVWLPPLDSQQDPA